MSPAAPTLAEVTQIAVALESPCQTQLAAQAVAQSSRLSAKEMAVVIERFRGYRQPRRGEA